MVQSIDSKASIVFDLMRSFLWSLGFVIVRTQRNLVVVLKRGVRGVVAGIGCVVWCAWGVCVVSPGPLLSHRHSAVALPFLDRMHVHRSTLVFGL